ncbi:MAG: SUMF1/EgtB/PvdO family nonheme iron enzyme [Anaerolineae bacterium]|nr:SUMF1/EgtB/PvdO family nonheme iron enzyme [Anaerolineae bacterium]
MKLFISYARVDKTYCMEIVELLNDHEVWFDSRLHVGKNWWHEILKKVDWCEGFIYLLSPDSVESSYCKREYDLAKNMGRMIFPILIRDTETMPDDLAETHYVDIRKGITVETVKALLASIHHAELSQPHHKQAREQNSNKAIDPLEAFTGGMNALQKGLFDDAVFLLKLAKANGYNSPFIRIDEVLEEAERYLKEKMSQVERERNYKHIVELIRTPITEKIGWEAFANFRTQYPDYDPENLAKDSKVRALPKPSGGFTLPLLEWCDVPEGKADITDPQKKGRKTVVVPAFAMSKYMVTNAQFQMFVDDPKGFHNRAWWGYDPQAYASYMRHPFPRDIKYDGAERPRTRVTWYEAMAFCQWLSDKLGYRVGLYNYAQWVRAYSGDDKRAYPWGNSFDKTRCNTRESQIRIPTVVTRYTNGVSPFGLHDMMGNVWKWSNDISEDTNQAGVRKQIIRGGSFTSPVERADAHFAYDIDPNTFHISIGFRLVKLD